MINLTKTIKIITSCTIIMLFESCTITEHDKITVINSYKKGICYYSIGNLRNNIVAPCGCAQVGDSVGTIFKNMYGFKEEEPND